MECLEPDLGANARTQGDGFLLFASTPVHQTIKTTRSRRGGSRADHRRWPARFETGPASGAFTAVAAGRIRPNTGRSMFPSEVCPFRCGTYQSVAAFTSHRPTRSSLPAGAASDRHYRPDHPHQWLSVRVADAHGRRCRDGHDYQRRAHAHAYDRIFVAKTARCAYD